MPNQTEITQTTKPELKVQTHFVPDDELMKLYRLVREALELKYKILDVLYPKMYSWKEMGNNSVLEMRDVHKENHEKLAKIRELVEGFHP